MSLSTMIEFDISAIGIVVRRLRKEKGMSQEVLSGFAGIARSHLAMIETRSKIPNLVTIWRIAAALELHPFELIKLIEDEISQNHS